MIARPKKKELSAESRASITQASSRQTGTMTSPKTYDPNYPVYDIPVNKKHLIYIPNHTVSEEDGSVSIRMDKYAAHSVRMGKAYSTVRCSSMVMNDELKLDGSCPLCDNTTLCWELVNKQFSELAKANGMDPEAPETVEALKEQRRTLIHDMVISKAEVYYTFPIVVIDCEEGTVKPKLDADGRLIGTPMFYTVRESTYLDKWVKAFDSLADGGEEDVDYNPAGRWAILNFTYTPKSGQHNKRDSAKALSVTFVSKDNYAEYAKYYDQLTEEWTPEKAQDVLVANALRDMDEMIQVAEELIKPVRDKLAIYSLGAGTVPTKPAIQSTNAEQALAQFGATPVPAEPSAPAVPEMPTVPTGEMPNVGVQ